MAESEPPIVIAGRYSLSSTIGKGGMGVVYRGTHVGTGRAVAVKLLVSAGDELASRRFLREARVAASVSHPNLVNVLDVGTADEHGMYLVLELLEGEPLDAHLRRKGPMRLEDALDTLVPILDALTALHDAGVVHRDVKPANIFLSVDGTARVVPKLLDLGISKRLEPGEALTETGMMMGTPHYMSPEQARGVLELGIGVDVWAMGVVLFEALAGERPFTAETMPGLLHKIATDRPPSIGSRVPTLPSSVAAEIDRALAYEASSRHASARALADSLVETALEAGRTLTCRMPAGPRISLEMFAPARAIEGDDRTPILGSQATPMLSPRALEIPPSVTPQTRDLVHHAISEPLRASESAPAMPSQPVVTQAERDPTPEPVVSEAPSEPIGDDDEELTPSEQLRRATPSPLRWALPAGGVLVLATVGTWLAISGGDVDPAPLRSAPSAASEPPGDRALTRTQTPPDPPREIEEPLVRDAPQALDDRDPVVAPDAGVRRARARLRPVTDEPSMARPPDRRPAIGTNAAPIIED